MPDATPVEVATTPAQVVAVTHPLKFLPPAGHGAWPSPCGGGGVKREDLAVLTVLLPLADLRQQGKLDINVSKSKKLFVTFTSVKVSVKDATGATGRTAALLEAIKQREDLDSGVGKWLGGDYQDPWAETFGRAVLDGVDAGCWQWVDAHRNVVAALFKGDKTLQPQCDKIATIEPEADRLVAVWRQFSAGADFKDIHSKVEHAIRSHTETDDGPDFD